MYVCERGRGWNAEPSLLVTSQDDETVLRGAAWHTVVVPPLSEQLVLTHFAAFQSLGYSDVTLNKNSLTNAWSCYGH